MAMTRGERQELGQLIRKREKVMRAQAKERSAALLADFDASMAKIYHYDEDPVWKKIHDEAEAAVAAAQSEIEDRCVGLGIPKEFAPGLSFHWHGRGHNAVQSRRSELRRAAKSRVEALETEALAKIERLSLEAQTEVIANGLESDAAKDFLNTMPQLDALMPTVEVGEIETLIETRRRSNQLEWMN